MELQLERHPGPDGFSYPIVDSRAIENDELLRHAQRAVATCPRLALLLEELAPRS